MVAAACDNLQQLLRELFEDDETGIIDEAEASGASSRNAGGAISAPASNEAGRTLANSAAHAAAGAAAVNLGFSSPGFSESGAAVHPIRNSSAAGACAANSTANSAATAGIAGADPGMNDYHLSPSLAVGLAGVPGLTLIKGLLSPAKCAQYLSTIDSEGWFAGGNQAMRFGQLPPWSVALGELAAPLLPERLRCRHPLFDQFILNLYHPGDGIKAHVDLLKFEDGVVVFSFGDAAVMQLASCDDNLPRRHTQVRCAVLQHDTCALYGIARLD